MATLQDLLHALLKRRRRPALRVPIVEKLAHFRVIGTANNTFLEHLSELVQGTEAPLAVGFGAVDAAYDGVAGPVAAMVRSLVHMSGGRYTSLLRRFEELDRELAVEVLGRRPIEFGPPVLWPGAPEPMHPAEAGLKAARLSQARLTGAFDVPPFFVVSTYGYRMFMEGSGLEEMIDERAGRLDLHDPGALRCFSAEIREAVLAAAVPRILADAMAEAYRTLVGGTASPFGVAVRSSAVVEDGAASFAGQFGSVLNVDEATLLDAYRTVIASKYRFEALSYGLARGVLVHDVAMPVLVMPMVQPLAAGVAYSRDLEHPGCAVVTAVPGLARPIAEGTAVPDRFVVLPAEVPEIVEARPGSGGAAVRCRFGVGLVEEAVGGGEPALSDEVVRRVAETAWALEEHFGTPQDVEWAADAEGRLWVVQTRPLHLGPDSERRWRPPAVMEGYRLLVRDAARASGGVACGRVFWARTPESLERLPEGAILVVPTTTPALAGVMHHVAAIVAAAGSATGHMATVARELGVPCLVGVEDVLARLGEGVTVTVDGWSGCVYEGEVRELLGPPREARAAPERRDPVRDGLARLTAHVAPLTLTDPDSPSFRPASCRTLHDIARFVHQTSMAEMFSIETLAPRERRQARRLEWRMPMEVRILDLGGGLAAGSERSVGERAILSAPFAALLEGMTDPRLRWAGPVGFDLRGFMSVVVRSAADDQRYGEPSYALCSRDYLHFASRLAYHFATVDSVCGRLVNENYARFLFFGGAAEADRRELRAHFLATVLEYNGFAVKRKGDRVEAILAKRGAETIEEALVMLGRLMVASRHLDMVMESRATAETFARAFLSGDYGFELVRAGSA